MSGEQLGAEAALIAASLSESLDDDTPVSSLSSQLQLADAALSVTDSGRVHNNDKHVTHSAGPSQHMDNSSVRPG